MTLFIYESLTNHDDCWSICRSISRLEREIEVVKLILGGFTLGYNWKNKKTSMKTYIASNNVTELEYIPHACFTLDELKLKYADLNKRLTAMEVSRAGKI